MFTPLSVHSCLVWRANKQSVMAQGNKFSGRHYNQVQIQIYDRDVPIRIHDSRSTDDCRPPSTDHVGWNCCCQSVETKEEEAGCF